MAPFCTQGSQGTPKATHSQSPGFHHAARLGSAPPPSFGQGHGHTKPLNPIRGAHERLPRWGGVLQNNRLDEIQPKRRDYLPPPCVHEKRHNSPFASALIQTFQAGDYLFISIKVLGLSYRPITSRRQGRKTSFGFGVIHPEGNQSD